MKKEQLYEKMNKIISENKEYFLEIFKNALSLNTVNPPGEEDKLAQYIKTIAEKEGLKCELQEVEKGRSNVIIEYESGNKGKTLLWNAHMDVVSPGKANWNTDPFDPTLKDGRMYARGSADDKGGLIAMLVSLIVLKRLNIDNLNGKLIYCGVMGEEASGIGTKFWVENGGKADGAIVGEPSKLELVIAHRGAYRPKYIFYGKTAHSSEPQNGENAIYYACNFIKRIEQLNNELLKNEYPLTGASTIAITICNGGEKVNVIPDKVEVALDRRISPLEKIGDVQKQLEEILEDLHNKGEIGRYEFAGCLNYKGSAIVSENEEIVKAAKLILKEEGMFDESKGMRATTDMYLLTDAGIPTIIYAPGDMALAHTPNESIPMDEFYKSIPLYVRIALKFWGYVIE